MTSANVEVNEDSQYVYTASFLPEGEYTIAFTCRSDLDGLETDDDLAFQDIKLVEVEAPDDDDDEDEDDDDEDESDED